MRHFASKHRFSTFACAALAGILVHPGLVSAVALGNIAQQSSLGQPLRVIIPVALNAGETLTTQCLKLVRNPEPGAPQLMAGRVSVERTATATRVVVTTPKAIDEPAMRLSLEAGCSGTVRREYALLLDPQGTPGDVILASADVDEFANYRGAALPAMASSHAPASHRAEPVMVAAAQTSPAVHEPVIRDIAPSKTTFAPIADFAPAPVAQPRTQKPVAPVPVASVQVAVATPPAPQREPVALTTMQTGGFIAEASASPLSRVSTGGSNPTAAPIANALPRSRAPVPEATLWMQTWPYGAIGLSLVAIALTAFAKRKRIAVPAWGAPTVLNHSKSDGPNSANTFAHFGAMTEPVAPGKRAEMAYPTVSGDSTYDGSLDTLLEQVPESADPNVVNDNDVDEHTIRQAYATLANEGAVDIGTDSILKAIAEAERELRIGRPEPKQAAIDKALDDDLLREPKLRK
jgi:hypothetical protein